MARVLFLFYLMFVILSDSFAQDYSIAVNSLAKELKKTSSGKQQLKGKDAKAFDQLAVSIRKELEKEKDVVVAFKKMSRLVDLLRDNHLAFYEKSGSRVVNDSLFHPEWISRYQNDDFFKNFPTFPGDLEKWEAGLAGQADEWCGVYYYLQNKILKVGIGPSGSGDTLVAVILDSKLPIWKRGQVLGWIWKGTAPGRAMMYAFYAEKNWNYVRNLQLVNNRLALLNLTKEGFNDNYLQLSSKEPLFSFRRLDGSTDYIRIGSFSTFKAFKNAGDSLFPLLPDSVSAPNIIVDLRNNGGGSGRIAKRFAKQIKKFAKKKKVYLVFNQHTVSAAEMFIIDLKKHKNIFTAGENTPGMITYGNNAGTRANIESSNFGLYITDMPGKAKHFRYEDIGLVPAIKLDPSRDWIEQLMELIKKSPR